MKLILVRHGETEWNAEQRIQGWKDSQLTDKGEKQAKEVADFLNDEKIDVAYSSDLGRALQTSEAIMKHHKCKLIKDKRLREMSYGIFEGLTVPETNEIKPGLWEQRNKDRYHVRVPGGESYKIILAKKIHPFMEMLEKEHANETVLLVSHRGPFRCIFAILFNVPPLDVGYIKFENNCVYFLDVENRKGSNSRYFLVGELKKGNSIRIQQKTEW